MSTQEKLDFARVAEAIAYIRQDFKNQPCLEQIAEKVGLSPAHFQRLFTNWAGVSPKKFLQYITIEYAKGMLRDKEFSLSDTAHEAGLSGTGRLHDLFVTIEGMTPGEYKNGGQNLLIHYSFTETLFGAIITAATSKGLCYMAFVDDEQEAFESLQAIFPRARYILQHNDIQRKALIFFSQDWHNPDKLKLHIKGTDFQLKVWETLLKIPLGALVTYGDIAAYIGNAGASRAVGSAVGDNPISLLIPCHRVIRASGALGGYHWGLTRKTAIIGWEASRKQNEHL